MKCNAVFEGGGVKAIALVGAVKAAEEHGIKFEHVAGTSSGSIIASFLAAGYNADEMKDMILEMPFSQFIKKSWLHRIALGHVVRLFWKKGLYSGHKLEEWVKETLKEKGIHTFSNIKPGRLQIIASDISNGKILILPQDIQRFGIQPAKLEVSRAIRMSSSIPYFFDPVMIKKPPSIHVKGRWRKKKPFSGEYVYIVDGAILSNFPLWLFDRKDITRFHQHPTIGFQLVGQHEGKAHRIKGPLSMFQALFSTMMDAHDERYIEMENRFRTIKVPTLNVRTTQFDLSREKSLELYEAGYQAGKEFFMRWSYEQYMEHYQKYVVTLHSSRHFRRR
ncbi:patatin-like phospholipase family protein [Marinicrinis sediminis]|uniref:Patatin-like phospholipase family protein n=1 Tax=Marinicrinis sediminis TaxID=1652465 RepID=A0ABW5RDG1_9BACL